MDKMSKHKLWRAFVSYVAASLAVVLVLSALVIWGCAAVRSWLLPKDNQVYLNIEERYEDGAKTESSYLMTIGEEAVEWPFFEADNEALKTGKVKYSLKSLETDYTMLTPKRRFLYHACGVGMVVIPLLFSMSGILICGVLFYNKRLKTPIEILSSAAEKIAEQDLDFEVVSPSDDELGSLCVSFEQMRGALAENNRNMWDMLEERRKLQASVAHDLRNPIAIIESHAEYLRINIPGGSLNDDRIISIADNIGKAAKRLENYTESMRTINNLEELEISKKPTDFMKVCKDMEEDFKRMAEMHGISLKVVNNMAGGELLLDSQVLYRILENLVGNALRYAENEIKLLFSGGQSGLEVCVQDDGPGFSENILSDKIDRGKWFISDSSEPEHSGIGLTVSSILCRKHGGRLSIGNSEEGGAYVKFSIKVW